MMCTISQTNASSTVTQDFDHLNTVKICGFFIGQYIFFTRHAFWTVYILLACSKSLYKYENFKFENVMTRLLSSPDNRVMYM